MVPTCTTCCNIYNFSILPKQWICSLWLLQTTAITYPTTLTGLCRGEKVWSLWGRNLIFTHVLNQRCINFPKIWQPSQNSRRQKDDMKQLVATEQNPVATATRCQQIVQPWFKLVPIFKGSCRLFRTVWWRPIIPGIMQGRPDNRTSTSPRDRIPQVAAIILVLSF